MYTTIFFSLPLPTMAFSCGVVSCQATRSSDMTINKCGFMLLSLPLAAFYDAVLFSLFFWAKINSCGACIELKSYMTLSYLWIYDVGFCCRGHGVAVEEDVSLGGEVVSKVVRCLTGLLYLYFFQRWRQGCSWSYYSIQVCLTFLLQRYRNTEYYSDFNFINCLSIPAPLKDIASCTNDTNSACGWIR